MERSPCMFQHGCPHRVQKLFLTNNHVVADITEGGFFEDVLLEDVSLVFWQLLGSGGGGCLAV